RHVQTLRATTEAAGANALETALVQRIAGLVRGKLEELQAGIDVYRSSGEDAAQERLRGDAGKNIMDQLRQATEELMARKDMQQMQRRQAWVEAASASNFFSGIG